MRVESAWFLPGRVLEEDRMIFFDIDQTLLDHAGAANKSILLLTRQRLGEKVDDESRLIREWQSISDKYYAAYLTGAMSFEQQRRARMDGLFGLYGQSLTKTEADRLFDTFLETYEQNWETFPDVLSCLNKLADAGYRLGIISNGNMNQQIQKLQALKLRGYFSVVVASGEIHISKPDPRIFQEACRRGGVELSECIYIGDSYETDAVGSKAAGMKGIWLNRDGQDLSSVAEDIPMIRSLGELQASI